MIKKLLFAISIFFSVSAFAQENNFNDFLHKYLGKKTIIIAISDIQSNINQEIILQLKDSYKIEVNDNIIRINTSIFPINNDPDNEKLISLLLKLEFYKYKLFDSIKSREHYNEFSGNESSVGKKMETKAVKDGLINQ